MQESGVLHKFLLRHHSVWVQYVWFGFQHWLDSDSSSECLHVFQQNFEKWVTSSEDVEMSLDEFEFLKCVLDDKSALVKITAALVSAACQRQKQTGEEQAFPLPYRFKGKTGQVLDSFQLLPYYADALQEGLVPSEDRQDVFSPHIYLYNEGIPSHVKQPQQDYTVYQPQEIVLAGCVSYLQGAHLRYMDSVMNSLVTYDILTYCTAARQANALLRLESLSLLDGNTLVRRMEGAMATKLRIGDNTLQWRGYDAVLISIVQLLRDHSSAQSSSSERSIAKFNAVALMQQHSVLCLQVTDPLSSSLFVDQYDKLTACLDRQSGQTFTTLEKELYEQLKNVIESHGGDGSSSNSAT